MAAVDQPVEVCARRPYAGQVVRWVLVVILLAGCRQIAGLDDPITHDGGPGDGAGSGSFCYGTGLVRVCFDEQPSGMLTIAQNIDTGAFGCSTHVISGGTGMCVIAGATITLASGQQIAATGPTTGVPLVLVATDTISIDGTLDAGAHHNGSTTPAGGNFTGCQAGTNPTSGTYGGGGQGGSFGAKGGDGGGGGGTNGGTAGAPLATPTLLHGGCSGHSGGGGGGNGGKGGGAVYLIAGTAIEVSGRLDTSGAGGSGDGDNAGAGGGAGGSGGMIGLDAASIVITGAVCAVGGGGAAGAVSSQSQAGGDATGATSACVAGIGGVASAGAGTGGGGGLDTAGSAGMAGTTGGGGGGGGGPGFIAIYGTRSGGGVIHPAP
jgi:hypothetical protein